MLDGMRKAAQGDIGRFVMTVVLGLIIFSFAVWGIGDMFRDFTSNKVASVGSASITAQQFQTEFQNLLYQYQRRAKIPLTNQQARAMGLDQQVLQRLIDEAALDQETSRLGLSISDASIAEAARGDPNMQDASGQFNRAAFDQALRDSGLTERAFFEKQRQIYLRQQLDFALIDSLNAPKPLLTALAAAQGQTRAIDYFTLPASAAGDIPAPSEATLKAFFEERKAAYRAPEFRAISVLDVSPAALAKPQDVTDADAHAVYDKEKDARFTTPEKRDIQQIVFPNAADADAAEAKIKAGATFDDIAKERKLGDADLNLGDVAKADIFDPAIGTAAFALPAPGVTGVVKGQFGYLILRVASITPGSVKPYEAAAEEIKQGIANSRAADQAQDFHDKIEDARVAGKTLPEAAKAVGLEAHEIPAVDAEGNDPSGNPVALPDKAELLRAVFASDVGVDNAAISTKDRGFVWFDVTKVDPARDRSFEEVKDKVEKAWRASETAKALAAKAADLVKQVDSGATLQSVAQNVSAEVKSASGVKRSGGAGLPESVVAAVFALPSGKAGSASGPDGRVVFKITGDETPPYDPNDAAAKSASEQLNQGLETGVIEQYLAALKRKLGVKVNTQVLQGAEAG